MTIVQAQLIGDKVLLERTELDRLVELARKSEPIAVELTEDDLPTTAMMGLADQGHAFDFWLEEGQDIYTAADGEPI